MDNPDQAQRTLSIVVLLICVDSFLYKNFFEIQLICHIIHHLNCIVQCFLVYS